MQKAINFNDLAIVSVKGSDYRTHFWYVSKDDARNIKKNFDFKKWIAMNFSIIYENEWNNLL